MISIEYALPLLIFLISSFLAFYFVETLILLTLNYAVRKYWRFLADKLLRAVVRHRAMMRIASFGVIALIVVLLFMYTSLADLLVSGIDSNIMRFLGLILITTMLVVYYIGSRNLHEVVIVQRIHLFIFIILSLFAFTGIMGAARNHYALYKEAINRAFFKSMVTGIETDYEERIEERLLAIFREKLKNNECGYYDYAEKEGTGFTQFRFIGKDLTLVEANPEIRPANYPPAGKECVHETKFLLTSEGRWYEVIERY